MLSGCGFPPVFNNIFTASIVGTWEKRRGFTHPTLPHTGVILPSEPVSQYRCMNLPKTDDNDRAHKNDGNTLS